MRTRLVGGLVVFAMLASTGGLVAATGGGAGAGNAATAQYHGKKTCADLVRANRAAEQAIRRRHRDQERQFRGGARSRLHRLHLAEERGLHSRHLAAERQCRKDGGRR